MTRSRRLLGEWPYWGRGLGFASTGMVAEAVQLCREDVDSGRKEGQVELLGRPGSWKDDLVRSPGLSLVWLQELTGRPAPQPRAGHTACRAWGSGAGGGGFGLQPWASQAVGGRGLFLVPGWPLPFSGLPGSLSGSVLPVEGAEGQMC